jgi:hypothetical protein
MSMDSYIRELRDKNKEFFNKDMHAVCLNTTILFWVLVRDDRIPRPLELRRYIQPEIYSFDLCITKLDINASLKIIYHRLKLPNVFVVLEWTIIFDLFLINHYNPAQKSAFSQLFFNLSILFKNESFRPG